MSAVKKVFLTIAAVGVAFFAPQIIPAIGGWFGASGFLASAIGSLVLATGLTALQTVLGGGGSRAPSADAGKVNVRLTEATRWLNAGEARQGGASVFGEFDAQGNFWYIVVHSDSLLHRAIKYFFDDVELTLDANGNVTNNDFCLNTKKEPYTGSGTRVTYFRIWTTTYTDDDPKPPAIEAFKAAFPQWTDDHVLAGTTYSVVKCSGIKIEDRYKIYRWRGPFGIGEPGLSVVGEWSRPYDPRTGEYAYTRNAALIAAWFRTHRFGRNKPFDSVDWDRVAQQADICDQIVIGIDGSQPRYECSASVPDNKERYIAESELLLASDAQIVFSDTGKWWPRVGYYYTPTLSLSRNRDIVAMQSVEAGNGESETQGVIVRYTDPASNYAAQPSAPWVNPLYFDPASAATYLTVDALSVTNHNQAMRLAKAIGQRSQPPHKIVPSTGLRGLRARQERIALLNYDNTFSGDYEIVTPVEVNEVGMFCGFGAVPVDENRWTLLPGEEKSKTTNGETTTPGAAPAPSNVSVQFNNGRIEATFDPPNREDVTYEFEYISSADIASDTWTNMFVQIDTDFAYSGTLDTSVDYTVRWRSVTGGGVVSPWAPTPYYSLSGTPQPLAGPTDLSVATPTAGEADLGWRNPADPRFNFTRLYRGTTNTFADATAIADVPGGLSALMMYTDEGLTGDTYYWWFRSIGTDGVLQSDPPSGPLSLNAGDDVPSDALANSEGTPMLSPATNQFMRRP